MPTISVRSETLDRGRQQSVAPTYTGADDAYFDALLVRRFGLNDDRWRWD